jgi:hypothetical protein
VGGAAATYTGAAATVGYYLGFCSYLNDENCENGGHFELSVKR